MRGKAAPILKARSASRFDASFPCRGDLNVSTACRITGELARQHQAAVTRSKVLRAPGARRFQRAIPFPTSGGAFMDGLRRRQDICRGCVGLEVMARGHH